ncbi:MAG: hypothetical protein WAO19_08740 [Candidatus Kryptoniota bacterium]
MLDNTLVTGYLFDEQEGAIPDHGTGSGHVLVSEERLGVVSAIQGLAGQVISAVKYLAAIVLYERRNK